MNDEDIIKKYTSDTGLQNTDLMDRNDAIELLVNGKFKIEKEEDNNDGTKCVNISNGVYNFVYIDTTTS